MEGLFQLLLIAFVLWAWSRGARSKKPRPPIARTGEGEAQDTELDWDRAIGDVLEGLGLPRPQPKGPPPGATGPRLEPRKAGRPREATGMSKVARPEARRARPEPRRPRFEPRPGRPEPAQRPAAARVSRGAPDRELVEIAGLAEAAAVRREKAARAQGVAESRRAASAVTPAVEEPAPTASGRGRAPAATPPGLTRLRDLSELERAIVYAEILGPPKSLEP